MDEEPLNRIKEIIYPEAISEEMINQIHEKLYKKIERCVDPTDINECAIILYEVLNSDLHEGFKLELENFYKDLLRFFNE